MLKKKSNKAIDSMAREANGSTTMSKMEAVLKGCSTVASSVEWHLKMAGWSVLHPCGWFNNCNTGFLSMDEMK